MTTSSATKLDGSITV